MKNKVFDLNDIIMLTISMIEDLQNDEKYDDTLDIPQHISDKIDMLDEDSCENLFLGLEDIAKEVNSLKNGELHELNLMHKEVMILAKEKLYEYIK